MEPGLELLDRQVAFLLRQPGDVSFLVQVEPFLRALQADEGLASYLDDLRDELVRVIQVLEAVDRELVSPLVALRDELVELRPEADDSHAPPPPNAFGGAPQVAERLAYEQTLAFFDERAAKEPDPFNYNGEGGKARALLSVLQGKDERHLRNQGATPRTAEAGELQGREPHGESAELGDRRDAEPPTEPQRTELDRWRVGVGNLDRRLEHARRWMRLRARTSAGIALLKLEAARDAMQPPLKLVDPDESRLAMLSDALKLVSSSDYSLLKVADDERLTDVDERVIAERVADLRTSTERLHEELRRRIGTTRSRLALVNRFKQRCEWHDRERMLAVGDENSGGGPEDRLTAEFARYLFDQGLSPLTKPLAGGLQPDLLDPGARFYVEAKQYMSSARAEIVKGVAQVLDTVGRLRGGPYQVEEAFCVVFRRSGPYYDLPLELRTETYRLHLILVDLAPATEAGRRQTEKPVVVPVEEFFAAEPGGEARAADGGARRAAHRL